jgi:hypothetical protein
MMNRGIYFAIPFFSSVLLLMLLGFNPAWAQHDDDVVINPLTALSEYLRHPQNPAPVGIGAYGFYYDNGVLQPIVVTTNKEFAIAKINSLSAYNPDLQQHQNGANLQFNIMMEVKSLSGTSLIWLQNTNRFDTYAMKVNSPRDLIFNLSTPKSNIIAYGKGTLSPISNQIIYSYGDAEQPYSLPLTIKLGIASQVVTNGVMVYFYNEPFGGGTFDKVFLPFQNVISANLIVAPAHKKPVSIDSELIWSGYCCSYETTFNNMDSYLSMYYEDSTGKNVPYPALFTFGTETAEKADNLQVLPSSSGGHVVIGKNNNHFLEQLGSISPAPTDEGFLQLRQQLGMARENTTESQQENSSSTSIPAWIKNNAKWWTDGTIDDSTFASGIQYLIKQGIIQVPATQTGSTTSQQIPSWVKNNAKWWTEGQVSDDEFIKAVQYLITSGIIQVNS